MVTSINKDILSVEKGIIVHQVNCLGVMGGGLAKKISDKWPVVKDEYISVCRGTLDKAELLGKLLVVKVSPTLLVCNVFGQLWYGSGRCYTNYRAVANAFYKLRLQRTGPLSIYLPHGVCCGLAGGDWHVVSAVIEQELPDAIICNWDK